MHSVEAAVAERVRRLRAERGWTLDVAAAELGVSRRSLVQVEAGTANPSLTTLLRLASGFGIPLAQLVDAEQRPPVIIVSDVGTELWHTRRGSRARLLVACDALELWQWTIAPGDRRSAEAHAAGTSEALLVTAGELTIVVGDAEERIAAPQSALFGGDLPHVYRNDTDVSVEFILAVHEPIANAVIARGFAVATAKLGTSSRGSRSIE